ncbi:MAG: OmpA family protein [Leeuwenhoekiella sp.]
MGLSSVSAQDDNNPWTVSIGVNAVDAFPDIDDELKGKLFDEYFNNTDHWNILPSVSTLYVGRNIGSNLSFGIRGSVNRLEKYGDLDYFSEEEYYGIDGMINYSFLRALSPEGTFMGDLSEIFDLYGGLGVGYTWIGDLPSFVSGNANVGLKIHFNDNIYLHFESLYKWASFEGHGVYIPDNIDVSVPTRADSNTDIQHRIHSVGIGFNFGGTDTDGDGIYDKNDECPETPGLEEFNGCPDTDGDGIKDSEDDCPETPGLPEFNGCPDTDGDGVPDNEDACPERPGTVEMEGCPDSDGDGYHDGIDECPEDGKPEDFPRTEDGCPVPDADGDGVNDDEDACPEMGLDVTGSVGADGCPTLPEDVLTTLNGEAGRVLFNTDRATLRKSSYATLDAIVEILNEYPNFHFVVEGHADSRASDEYNMDLSDRRAKSVIDYLVEKGIAEDRLSPKPYGESDPIAPNTTAAGMQLNRRVKLTPEPMPY